MEKLLNGGLTAILCNGPGAMPQDLDDLRTCLESVHQMLAEKSGEHHPDRSHAEVAAAEIATLLDLEAAIARKAVEMPAGGPQALLEKFAIWEILAREGDGGAEDGAAEALVHSAIDDLRRMLHP